MKKAELKEAVKIAESKESLGFDSLELFDGFALPDFEPVHCRLTDVAQLLRWQAMQINGEWNQEALNEVAKWGRRRFIIIGN